MRKPLIAGNWKMNLNHLEAIAVTQKLSYSLDDKDYDAVDVCVVPPFDHRYEKGAVPPVTTAVS